MTERRRPALTRLERLQREVVACSSCQPYDKEDSRIFWCDGDRINVESFLLGKGVAESRIDKTAEQLVCPNCGSSFTRDDDIGIRSDEDRAREALFKSWDRKLARQLASFCKYVEAYPLLGANHLVGKRLLKNMTGFPHAKLPADGEWWRARVLTETDAPKSIDLGPPPAERCTSEGRFSHFGQRVFYLANSMETAAAEAIREDVGHVWLQRWALPRVAPILNLSSHFDEESVTDDASYLAAGLNYIRPHLAEASTSLWKPEYFPSRFIADAARAAGFRGVLYPSRRFYGDCLVIFEWNDADLKPIGEPKSLKWDRKAAEAALPF